MTLLRIKLILIAVLITHNAFSNSSKGNEGKRKSIIISCYLEQLEYGDSIQIRASNFQLYGALTDVYYARAKAHSFTIKIPCEYPVININILFPLHVQEYSLTNLILEPGDSIVINKQNCEEKNNQCLFYTGKNFEKLNCQKRLIKLQHELFSRKFDGVSKFFPSKENFSYVDSIFFRQLELLESYKDKISRNAYVLIKTNLLAAAERTKDFSLVNNYYEKDTRKYIKLLEGYVDPLWSMVNNTDILYSGLSQYSLLFVDCLLTRYRLDSCFYKNEPFSLKKCYNYIKNGYSGQLREKTISYLLYENRFNSDNQNEFIADAFEYFKNKDYKKILADLRRGNSIGAAAFDFTLRDRNDKALRLSNYNGRMVIMDFWYTGCGNCRVLYQKLKSIEKVYANDTAVVFMSVSIDKLKDVWKRSVDQEVYTSKHNVNLYTEGKGSEHEIIKYYNINGYPTLILISKSGKLLPHPIDPRDDDGENLISLIEQEIH